MKRRKGKNTIKPWQLAGAALVVIALVIYLGVRSGGGGGGEPIPLQAEVQPRPVNRPAAPMPVQSKVKVYTESASVSGGRSGSYEKVQKLIQAGIIKRINEPERKLFVNDPIWKVTTAERREYTIRVVAEYLDWVNGNATGKVDVRSFRTGGRLGGMNLSDEPLIEQ